MKTLKIDVIIPAYRPGEEFEKLLERLSAQKYPINKILVMNTEKKFWKGVSACGSPASYKRRI